jgi:hypothetical protein
VLVLVAVVVKVLIAGIIKMVVIDYFDWRSEIFLGSFSIYKDNLKNFFNPKYRSTIFNIQSEIFNNSGVFVSIFMIAEP